MRFKALVLATCLGTGFLAASGVQAQTPVSNPPPHFNATKIVLVGDSTTAVQGGWGPSFCAKHVTSFAACINLARGGRSSGNYRTEGSWALALNEIKSGGFNDTYVLVQFGHNDQPGKPGRSTDLATEFPANLKAYVDEIRAAGGKPVLVTPLTRRQFKDGKLVDDLGPWAEATRKVAAETGAPLVDLHADSHAAVQAMGAVEATRFAQSPPPTCWRRRGRARRSPPARPRPEPSTRRCAALRPPSRTTPPSSRWARPSCRSTTLTWARRARTISRPWSRPTWPRPSRLSVES
jgi:lysophospholipase L1-like esterase